MSIWNGHKFPSDICPFGMDINSKRTYNSINLLTSILNSRCYTSSLLLRTPFSVLNIRSYNRNLFKLNTSHASLISRQDITTKHRWTDTLLLVLLIAKNLYAKCQFRE